MNILFVCTGNTCRSSMAEGIFKQMLKDEKKEEINVSSAGISAFEGDGANYKAIDTLKEKGIDILNHRARLLTRELIFSADLVLTMTESHKKIILSAVPECFHKVFTLKEYALAANGEDTAGKNLDVADPFGLDYNVYEKVACEIEENLRKIINNIEKLQ